MIYNLENIKGQAQAKETMDACYEELKQEKDQKKRKSLFNFMKRLYDKYECIKKCWDYIEYAHYYIERFVKKIIASFVDNTHHDYFYIMRFQVWNWDKMNYDWKFDKIGSTVNIDRRIEQHKRYYTDASYDVDVLYTIDTGNISASSLEDYVRNYFIKKYGEENFLPKDRFTVQIDIEDIKKKIPTCLKALQMAVIA